MSGEETAKEKVCLMLPKEEVEKMKRIKEETGLSLASQILLKMKGYELKKKE